MPTPTGNEDIQGALNTAQQICWDESVGYNMYGSRQLNPNIDCSALVSHCLYSNGFDVAEWGNTTTLINELQNYTGFDHFTYTYGSTPTPQHGDIYVYDDGGAGAAGHTFFFAQNVTGYTDIASWGQTSSATGNCSNAKIEASGTHDHPEDGDQDNGLGAHTEVWVHAVDPTNIIYFNEEKHPGRTWHLFRWQGSTPPTPPTPLPVWHTQARGGYDRTSAEALDNCNMIWSILGGALGWSRAAVCAVLGNIEAESGYNPWRWENDDVLASNDPDIETSTVHGYGLGQFTPAGKYILAPYSPSYTGYGPNFSDVTGSESDGTAQLLFLNDHADYYSTSSYPISYADFKVAQIEPFGPYTLDWLTHAWFSNYERGTWSETRVEAATYWWDHLDPTPPGPEPPGPPPTPGPLLDDILILKKVINYNHGRGYL